MQVQFGAMTWEGHMISKTLIVFWTAFCLAAFLVGNHDAFHSAGGREVQAAIAVGNFFFYAILWGIAVVPMALISLAFRSGRKSQIPALPRALMLISLFVTVFVVTFYSNYKALAQTNTRSFYDGNGSFAGSSSSHNNNTSFSDRNGRFDGSAIRNSDGTTSFYDRNGHFTGSAVNTSPATPRR
jgi:hypothetical protein